MLELQATMGRRSVPPSGRWHLSKGSNVMKKLGKVSEETLGTKFQQPGEPLNQPEEFF